MLLTSRRALRLSDSRSHSTFLSTPTVNYTQLRPLQATVGLRDETKTVSSVALYVSHINSKVLLLTSRLDQLPQSSSK
jgi:hypothetical protein